MSVLEEVGQQALQPQVLQLQSHHLQIVVVQWQVLHIKKAILNVQRAGLVHVRLFRLTYKSYEIVMIPLAGAQQFRLVVRKDLRVLQLVVVAVGRLGSRGVARLHQPVLIVELKFVVIIKQVMLVGLHMSYAMCVLLQW